MSSCNSKASVEERLSCRLQMMLDSKERVIYTKNLGLFRTSLDRLLRRIFDIIDLTTRAFDGSGKPVISYDDFESELICANVVDRIFILPVYDDIQDAFVKLSLDLDKDHLSHLRQVWIEPEKNVALLVVTVLFWEGRLQ